METLPPPDRLLNSSEVMNILGIGRTSFWALRKEGNFPDAVDSVLRDLQWRESDIQNWLDRLKTRDCVLPSRNS